ncbi:GH116 family glycosyl-hydrolase [Nakamurella lactea]|uniref:GH116 family glycosyl-hydrolase n=1 Tax=Nakamurella lactea TaxID=459515 RepID=UPI0003FCCFAD|nr:GH116 family glycosyl-hydrolase [Nakamurella lactea]
MTSPEPRSAHPTPDRRAADGHLTGGHPDTGPSDSGGGTGDWPTVRRFTGDQLTHLKMPVGGIGTGCVSLAGNGRLCDWELFNRPAKGFDARSFFAVSVLPEGGERVTKVLEGELSAADLSGADGSTVPVAGLPRFREAGFCAAYPFGRVELTDPDIPLAVTVGAFNPLIPGDAEASGIPLLAYRVTLRNTGDVPVEVSVVGSVQNICGREPGSVIPENPPWRAVPTPGATVLLGRTDAVAEDAESYGTLALGLLGAASSTRSHWSRWNWRFEVLDFWDDFAADGQLDGPAEGGPAQGSPTSTASLVASRTLAPGASGRFDFLIGWHFPNRRNWTLGDRYGDVIVGNHYATQHSDAAAVLRAVIPRLDELERDTVAFVRQVLDSGVPTPVAEAALANLAVLKSPTCFRTADGTFYGWEGTWDDHGSCFGSCTHVWNYQYAVEELFPELAWTMRHTEFIDSTDDRGLMTFRSALPAHHPASAWPTAAADGQLGTIVRLHRLWRITGDDERLHQLWPAARRALEFAWLDGGWDADRDGVLEGCQHNTMDVEYYGPSGVNQSWYLAALAAAVELAEALRDNDFAATCRDLLTRGTAWTDRHLFNGEFYQQQIHRVGPDTPIAVGLRHHDEIGPQDPSQDPDSQIGPGCLPDQLVGYWMACAAGLTVPLDPEHVRIAMDSVVRYNSMPDFHRHANDKRSYVAADERGLVNAAYPRGGRPRRPFPYWAEVWTGIEYTAAIGLARLGRQADALTIVSDIRDRYDGSRRNPFDEVECGHHYVRSMASWGLLGAWPAR